MIVAPAAKNNQLYMVGAIFPKKDPTFPLLTREQHEINSSERKWGRGGSVVKLLSQRPMQFSGTQLPVTSVPADLNPLLASMSSSRHARGT